MKFPTIEEMAQNVAEKALDEYEYMGKTLREWIEIILATDNNVGTKPSTNLAEVGTDCSEFPNNSDAISRQAAIDALYSVDEYNSRSVKAIKQLPPIQPDIVRCKDCKYARLTDDGSCKYCDIWFPDEAEYMDGDYYCASAERREETT